MIGIDTNVFLRYVLADDEKQWEIANQFINLRSINSPILVDPIVWVESEWVMRTKYKLDREGIVMRLEVALISGQFKMEKPDLCRAALEDYRSKRAELVDCLVARLNSANGCSTTYTFDKKAARLTHATLLAPK
jgi:predicted nucleic-acid-binding protein